MAHWQEHLPTRYQALKDPQAYFTSLGEEAADRYLAIRDGLLDGVSPNNRTIGWAEFQDRVAQADQTAREIVGTEMIYLLGEDTAESPDLPDA
jgi:hypothetical protein